MRFYTLLIVLLSLATCPVQAEEILVGTGSKSGVYFQVGRSICRLVNRNLAQTTCAPLETAGSVSNLANVEGGSLEIGIDQAGFAEVAIGDLSTDPIEYREGDELTRVGTWPHRGRELGANAGSR